MTGIQQSRDAEQAGRRRRGKIIISVFVFIVLVGGGGFVWLNRTADNRASDVEDALEALVDDLGSEVVIAEATFEIGSDESIFDDVPGNGFSAVYGTDALSLAFEVDSLLPRCVVALIDAEGLTTRVLDASSCQAPGFDEDVTPG